MLRTVLLKECSIAPNDCKSPDMHCYVYVLNIIHVFSMDCLKFCFNTLKSDGQEKLRKILISW